jgi:pilus assembly protein CpaB
MRARTLILLLFAAILASSTTLLARAWLNSHKQVNAEAAPVALPPPTRSILVAHTAIQRGQILRPTDLTWQPWPENGINQTYVVLGTRKLEAFTGSVARNPIAPGEPITDGKIVAPGNRGFLAAVLRPGMRAISVPVTATSGISGFVFPGDQVDILITYTVPAPPEAGGANPSSKTSAQVDHKAAETVLQNVRVIGIDQRLENKPGEAAIAHTATLEVTPKQSEIIALASEMGKLSLSLRSLAIVASEMRPEGESAPSDSSSNAGDTTYTLDSEVSPLLPKPLTGKETPHTGLVTILRGGPKSSESTGGQAAPRGS